MHNCLNTFRKKISATSQDGLRIGKKKKLKSCSLEGGLRERKKRYRRTYLPSDASFISSVSQLLLLTLILCAVNKLDITERISAEFLKGNEDYYGTGRLKQEDHASLPKARCSDTSTSAGSPGKCDKVLETSS